MSEDKIDEAVDKLTVDEALEGAKAMLAFAVREAVQRAGQVDVAALMARTIRLELEVGVINKMLDTSNPATCETRKLMLTNDLVVLAQKLKEPRLEVVKTIQ